MKHWIPGFLFLLLLFSCYQKPEYLHPLFMWDKSDSEKFDSAHVILQDAIYKNYPYSEKRKLLNELISFAGNNPDDNKKEILAYWKYRLMRDHVSPSLIADSVMMVIENADSLKRPYNYYMLWFLLTDNKSDVALNYFIYNELLKWFRQRGDSMQVGRLFTRLATLSNYEVYVHGALNREALDYYRLADRAFQGGGLEYYRIKNLINIAINTEDDKEADSLHSVLRGSSIIQNDTGVYEIVLRNSFIQSGNFDFIEKNIEMLQCSPNFKNELALNYAIKSQLLLENGNYQEASELNREAYRIIDNLAPTYYYSKITDNLQATYRNLGMMDSALKYTDEFLFWRDSLIRENDAEAFLRADAIKKITDSETLRHLQNIRTRWLSGIVILVIIVIALSVGFILYRNAKRKEIQALLSERELQKSRSSLAAHSLVLLEKDNMLKEMDETINRLKESDKISEEDARDICVAMKIHRSDEMERQDFLKLYEQLHPSFKSRLKADFPSLSEPQLRLCAYIACGLTNDHIARLLNIEAASLRTNRYRLRKKFSLSPDLSLEDFLRKYSE